ncbi:hypothetical protein CAP35_03580 [Chitinophagaceae bacterium IBVUCB1]|nr:hypothetical protein CAP35_03580 [Chitinophagaceae bacterium IBVUCB1]
MRRLLYSTTLALCLLPVAMYGQENKLSLDDCIAYALKHQAKMKNARLDQKSSLARNKEVTGLALPNLKLSGGINYAPLVAAFDVPNFIKFGVIGTGRGDNLVDPSVINQNTTSPDIISLAFQPKWTTNPQAEVSQILFDPGVMVALQARKRLEELAQKSLDLTEEQLRVAVIKAYYNVLIAEKRKGLLDQNVTRITQLEKETKAIFETGFAEKLDVDRVTIALTNLKTEENRVKQLVDLTYMALKFQIGMPLDRLISLTDTLSDSYIDKEILTHSLDFEKRKEFQLMQIQNKLYRYDLKRYKLGGLPTLVAFGNYGYTMFNSKNLFDDADKWQRSALLGIKLTIPVFDGMQRRNKMLQSKYALEKNENDIENLKYALEMEKESARISFESNISSLDNQRKNMKLAEEVYHTSQIKYKEGIGSNLEVMNAESALKEAQTNYFSALYDVINTRIDLQKALGEL